MLTPDGAPQPEIEGVLSRLVALTVIAIPNAMTLLVAVSRVLDWWPKPEDISYFPARPWLELQLATSLLIAIVGNIVVVANGVHHASLVCRTPWRTRLAIALCFAWAMPTAFAFVMPSENPYTGTGVPSGPLLGALWLPCGGVTAGWLSYWLLRQTLKAPRAVS